MREFLVCVSDDRVTELRILKCLQNQYVYLDCGVEVKEVQIFPKRVGFMEPVHDAEGTFVA